MKPILSKSTFVRGSKCLKSLYLYKHHYDLRDEVSQQQQAIFDQGHEVGMLARELFPAGTDCSVSPAYNYSESIKKTNEAIANGAKVIYEAGFVFNNVYVAVDILVQKKGRWFIYEVKSSTSVKDYHLLDAAIQLYVIQGCGLRVSQASIVHIDTGYVRNGNLDPKQLFNIADVTKEAKDYQSRIETELPVMLNVVASQTVPNMNIGAQCNKFYGCDFHGQCWKHFEDVEFPVYTISRLSEDKKWELIDNGILCQTQIGDSFSLSVNQRTQVFCNQNKSSLAPDVRALSEFISEIKFPVSFLDFETFNTAIPLFDNTKPYGQVPFQYSLHTVYESGELKHAEFLGNGKSDPRRALVEALINDIEPIGSVLCYYMSFERSRLEELADEFPQYRVKINQVISRLVDLIVPFRSKYIYDYRMNGSASIKDVLPALIPDLSYDDLEIGNGGDASQAYLDLLHECDDKIILATRTNLLEYCKLDTFAMVKLFDYIKGLIVVDSSKTGKVIHM
jgi:hypothetical protein